MVTQNKEVLKTKSNTIVTPNKTKIDLNVWNSLVSHLGDVMSNKENFCFFEVTMVLIWNIGKLYLSILITIMCVCSAFVDILALTAKFSVSEATLAPVTSSFPSFIKFQTRSDKKEDLINLYLEYRNNQQTWGNHDPHPDIRFCWCSFCTYL